jgi:hypothetical protein
LASHYIVSQERDTVKVLFAKEIAMDFRLPLAGLFLLIAAIAGCSDPVIRANAGKEIPDATPNPTHHIPIINIPLPNLRATAITCRERFGQLEVVGTVVNDGTKPATAFLYTGVAVNSFGGTTLLPDQSVRSNSVSGLPGLPADEMHRTTDVTLATTLDLTQIYQITFSVDPPTDTTPIGDIWELNESDNVLRASCSCAEFNGRIVCSSQVIP